MAIAPPRARGCPGVGVLVLAWLACAGLVFADSPRDELPAEVEDQAPLTSPRAAHPRSPSFRWQEGIASLVQVNVDAAGLNIVGDAANEPSLAVDPTNASRLVVGWRQFDSIASNFRQAGWAHSDDGGASWTFPGVLQPGTFRSDPVMTVDSTGRFVYYSLEGNLTTDTFLSTDGGVSWGDEVYAFGGDKAWITSDRTGGLGDGHLYAYWSAGLGCCGLDQVNRSVDTGASWEAPISLAEDPSWGTLAVGPDGEVYLAGLGASSSQFVVLRSDTLQDSGEPQAFQSSATVDLGGSMRSSTGPNPSGLLGQVWVAVDASPGPRRGWVYLLASVDPPGDDPLSVHFSRSEDGGTTWTPFVRVDDDAPESLAWQWFGTLSVAPNGRLDAIWNDSREDPGGYDSRVRYSSSEDGGVTWSSSEVVTPAFDPHVGWPQQSKIGDYYDMVSLETEARAVICATFNGEQDVYFLRLRAGRLFADGFESGTTDAWDSSIP